MVKLSLVDLVSIIFIESNKTEDVRYVSLNDVYYLNELLKLNSSLINIKYEFCSNVLDYYKIRFDYQAIFNFYENYNEYIISLKNNININDLEKHFKYLYNNDLKLLLQDIDFKDKFLRVR